MSQFIDNRVFSLRMMLSGIEMYPVCNCVGSFYSDIIAITIFKVGRLGPQKCRS